MMLPKIRRISSILFNENNKNDDNDSSKQNNKYLQSSDRLSYNSTCSSNKSVDDENNVYTETLLYIVHVDDIDLPVSMVDDIRQEIYDNHDDNDYGNNGQRLNSSNNVVRHASKRTTASFNERHKISKAPIYKRPSFSLSNPLQHLNSLMKPMKNVSTLKFNKSQLSSSMTTSSSSCIDDFGKENQLNNRSQCNEILPLSSTPFCYDNPILIAEHKSMIRADGPGLSDGYVNENCYFDLNAPNVELQKLVIAIDGPAKADIQIEIVDIGTYRVCYACQASGIYRISVTYDGEHVNYSPYNLRLRSKSFQEQVVPPNISCSIDLPRASIEPIEFNVNTPCIVTVRPTMSSASFQAYIQAPSKNINLPIIVHKSAKSEFYEIYFVPNICGNYWLYVSLNHIPIYHNPQRLIVRPYSYANYVTTSVQNLFHGYSGALSQFFVSKTPNDQLSGKGIFSVDIAGPSTVFLNTNETEHGYEFHYKPMQAGKYIITIKKDNTHIQGSPFTCNVYKKLDESRRVLSTTSETETNHGSETTTYTTTETTKNYNSSMSTASIVNQMRSSTRSTTHVDLDILRSSMTGDASQVCVFGTGLYETKSGRKTTFKIDASQAGPGLLLVGLYSSLGAYERLAVKRIMSLSPAYVYKVSYRVRIRGQYMLIILYGSHMQHVPGSPYLINVE